MKSLKVQLMAAIAMTMVAALTIGSSTYAWFAMNKTVTASGMMVKAQAEGSIIITDTQDLPTAADNTTDYSFKDSSATLLYTSTHGSATSTFSTGLKTLTTASAADINIETGISKNSKVVLSYTDATNSTTGGKTYYKDYSVYIAGASQEFKDQDITVSLNGVVGASVGSDINKAISVDFYGKLVEADGAVEEITKKEENYKGTLNVAGYKNGDDGKSRTAYTSFTIKKINIPEATGEKAYAVVMRVYYDGALLESGGAQPYTEYEDPQTSTAQAGIYYYSDDQGTGPITISTGESLPAGTKVVKTGAKAYARTTSIADIANVTLTATFKAADTTTSN